MISVKQNWKFSKGLHLIANTNGILTLKIWKAREWFHNHSYLTEFLIYINLLAPEFDI